MRPHPAPFEHLGHHVGGFNRHLAALRDGRERVPVGVQEIDTGAEALDAERVPPVLLGLPVVKADRVVAAEVAACASVADGGVVRVVHESSTGDRCEPRQTRRKAARPDRAEHAAAIHGVNGDLGVSRRRGEVLEFQLVGLVRAEAGGDEHHRLRSGQRVQHRDEGVESGEQRKLGEVGEIAVPQRDVLLHPPQRRDDGVPISRERLLDAEAARQGDDHHLFVPHVGFRGEHRLIIPQGLRVVQARLWWESRHAGGRSIRASRLEVEVVEGEHDATRARCEVRRRRPPAELLGFRVVDRAAFACDVQRVDRRLDAIDPQLKICLREVGDRAGLAVERDHLERDEADFDRFRQA